jgi:hypothetical protein
VGSKTFDGIWFIAYSGDHAPAHVHGFLGEVELIIDLQPVRQSDRRRNVKPANAKQSEVRRILSVAEKHETELLKLWETAHEQQHH